MQTISIWLLFLSSPLIIHLSVKLGRYGWLVADHKFQAKHLRK